MISNFKPLILVTFATTFRMLPERSYTLQLNKIVKLFGNDSAPYKILEEGLELIVIGNGPSVFNQVKSSLIGALNSAIDVLEDDIFNEIKHEKVKTPKDYSDEIFIVHGHDDRSKNEIEIFINELLLRVL